MKSRPAAPTEIPRVFYRRPLIDRPLGRYTAEWEGPEGRVTYQTVNRVKDWEGNWPSLYSVVRLPYVLWTYLLAKRSPILPHPVPFIVLDAIKRLRQLIRPGTRVLEVGGGNSTLWFIDQSCEVTVFEHDRAWADLVKGAARDRRPTIIVTAGEAGVRLMDELPDNSFDLALVDSTGQFPAALCIPVVRRKLKPGGWLVLDNSDMPANWRGVALMADQTRERYVGYSPMALKVSQTSFWRV
jgi:SAM-dependent methyltransferase